jgi:hypothetical protein
MDGSLQLCLAHLRQVGEWAAAGGAGHRHRGLSFAECGRYPVKGDGRAPRAHPADAPTPKWGLSLRHTNHLEGPQRNSLLPP